MNDTAGKWLGWIGIIVAVVGFFWLHYILGVVGIVLGLITLASPQKAVAWIAVVLGVIALIIGYFV